MELHMREQSRQVDQERWRLTQEESRLKAVQAALEDERRITMEQLSLQRAEVHVYYWNLISRVKATFFAPAGSEIKEMCDRRRISLLKLITPTSKPLFISGKYFPLVGLSWWERSQDKTGIATFSSTLPKGMKVRRLRICYWSLTWTGKKTIDAFIFLTFSGKYKGEKRIAC